MVDDAQLVMTGGEVFEFDFALLAADQLLIEEPVMGSGGAGDIEFDGGKILLTGFGINHGVGMDTDDFQAVLVVPEPAIFGKFG